MPHILFVCTGNILRSLSAHLALASILPPGSNIMVSSAGTHGGPHEVVGPDAGARLRHHNLDYSMHQSRLLTQQMLDSADVVVVMGTDHQAYIRDTFGRDVPLYLEIVEGKSAGLPDLHEIIPDHETNHTAARAFVYATVDRIVNNRMAFLNQLPHFLPKSQSVPNLGFPQP